MNPDQKIKFYIDNYLDEFSKTIEWKNNNEVISLLNSLELNNHKKTLFEIYDKILRFKYDGKYDEFFNFMNMIIETPSFKEYIKNITINDYIRYNNHMIQGMTFLGILVQNEKFEIIEYIVKYNIKIKFLYEFNDYCVVKDLYNKNRNLAVKFLLFLIKENNFSYEDYVRWKDERIYESNFVIFFKEIIKNDILFFKETIDFFKESVNFDYTLLSCINTYNELDYIRSTIKWDISNERIMELLFDYRFNKILLNNLWIDENFDFDSDKIINKINLSLINSANLIIREIRGKNEK